MTADPIIQAANDRLPETAPGHWDTQDGRDMAKSYAAWTRADIGHRDLSDFALANAVFLANRHDLDLIHYQTSAKERIRWLSTQLVLAETALTEANEARAVLQQAAHDRCAERDEARRQVAERDEALKPFAALAAVRYPEEGGAPSWIDIITNKGECDELELRSHVALGHGSQILDAADFRRAAALPPSGVEIKEEPCLTREEQRAQALRCSCRGADEWCVCQNSPDPLTRKERNQ